MASPPAWDRLQSSSPAAASTIRSTGRPLPRSPAESGGSEKLAEGGEFRLAFDRHLSKRSGDVHRHFTITYQQPYRKGTVEETDGLLTFRRFDYLLEARWRSAVAFPNSQRSFATVTRSP